MPEALHILLDTLLLLPPHLLHLLRRHLRMLRRAREEGLGRERPFALESHIALLRLLLLLLLLQPQQVLLLLPSRAHPHELPRLQVRQGPCPARILKSRARVDTWGNLLARGARRRPAVPRRLGDPLRGVSFRRASVQDGAAALSATAMVFVVVAPWHRRVVACAFGHPARRATAFSAP